MKYLFLLTIIIGVSFTSVAHGKSKGKTCPVQSMNQTEKEMLEFEVQGRYDMIYSGSELPCSFKCDTQTCIMLCQQKSAKRKVSEEFASVFKNCSQSVKLEFFEI